MNAVTNEKPRKADQTLIILALTLTCLGILLVFDASYPYALQHHLSVYQFVKQQAVWGVVGVALMAYLMSYPYWKLRRFGWYGVVTVLVLLAMVFLPHIGIKANGAHRWIGHGHIRIQPSEFAKLILVLYLARVCAGKFKQMANFKTGALPPLIVVLMLAGSVAIEPDLGTCLVLLGTGIAILFFAGMRRSHVVYTLVGLLVVGSLFIGFKALRHHDMFQINRLLVFLHPGQDRQGDGYQAFHSTMALGSGGFAGKGIGEGREKMYLPEAYTDFIFAILGEEGGLIATLLMLGLLVCLIARCFHIAATTKDPYGALLAAGFSTALGLQVFMNIGVVTATIPATGVPLPFISYGGSSLVVTLVMIGIILNIAKHPDGDPVKAKRDGERVADREFEMRWNRGQTLSRPEYREGLYGERTPIDTTPRAGR